MATSIDSTKHSSGDPSSTRWGRTGDPGSAFNGIGKPVKGRGNGRGRGRRGVAKPSPDPGKNSVLPASAIQKSNSTSGSSQVITSPPSPVIGRMSTSSSSTVPSSPSTLTSAGSRSQNRRRRSNAAKNNTSQSRQTSGAESRPSRQRPPELLPSQPTLKNITSSTQSDMVHPLNPPNIASDVKANIDALVERVRASAVANYRSGTPGSHIDWAGDDDDSLPDLDDWGIKSPVPVTGNAMISPILMDGLTPLPESASLDQAQHQVGTLVEESTQVHQPPRDCDGQSVTKVVDDADHPAPDRVLNEAKSLMDTQEVQASDNLSKLVSPHPSLPPKPASLMQQNARQPNHARNPRKRHMKSPINSMVLSNNVTFSPAPKHATKNDDQGREHDKEELGLAASIHAPSATGPQTSIANMTVYPTSKKPMRRSPVQPRAQTIRPPSSHAQSTMSHARSQSSPSLAKNNGRSPHRPVISGDAITKIAKTIGASASSSKSTPLSEVL